MRDTDGKRQPLDGVEELGGPWPLFLLDPGCIYLRDKALLKKDTRGLGVHGDVAGNWDSYLGDLDPEQEQRVVSLLFVKRMKKAGFPWAHFLSPDLTARVPFGSPG